MRRRWLLSVLVLPALSAGPAGGRAQAPDAPAEIRKAAEHLVDGVELESLQGEAWVKANRLDRPLHSYRDEEAGILDGGLFAFANGTNPELLLFIEARQGKGKASKPVWQFGVGRASYAQLHAEYEGKEVYFATWGDLVRGRDKPFWSWRFQATPPAAPPGAGPR